MDFAPTSEQTMIKQAAERFASEAHANGRADHWAEFAELGWLGLGVGEESGGFGGPLETMVLMEAFGRGAIVVPYAAQVVFAGKLLERAGRRDLLERLIDGSARFAVACEEAGVPFALDAPGATTATPRGGAYVVSGRKVRVLAGEVDWFVVGARTSEGMTLFAIPSSAPGVGLRVHAGEDGHPAAELELREVVVGRDAIVGEPERGLEPLAYGFDHALGALCAEGAGAMTAMHEMTVEYLKQRTQFGVPIGSFQALQHRAAEMYIELELARSMAHLAALTLAADPPPAERARALSAAKVQVARSGRFVGQNAIQLHGAIAMTEEYKLGRYFKRMTVIERLLGDVDFHVARYRSSS